MEDLAFFEFEFRRDFRDDDHVEGGAFEGLSASGFGVEEGRVEGFGFGRDTDFAGQLKERRGRGRREEIISRGRREQQEGYVSLF